MQHFGTDEGDTVEKCEFDIFPTSFSSCSWNIQTLSDARFSVG